MNTILGKSHILIMLLSWEKIELLWLENTCEIMICAFNLSDRVLYISPTPHFLWKYSIRLTQAWCPSRYSSLWLWAHGSEPQRTGKLGMAQDTHSEGSGRDWMGRNPGRPGWAFCHGGQCGCFRAAVILVTCLVHQRRNPEPQLTQKAND